MSHAWHKITGHSQKAAADREAAEQSRRIAEETQRITAQAEEQRRVADAARQKAEADRQAAEERARIVTEQNEQAEAKARGKEADLSDLNGMGFGEQGGQGDGGGGSLTGLGGVDPRTLTLGRRRRLGGG